MKRKSKANPNKLRVPIIIENEKQNDSTLSESNHIIKPTPRKTNFCQLQNNIFRNIFDDKQSTPKGINFK